MKSYQKNFREIRFLRYQDVRKFIDNVEKISDNFDVKNTMYSFQFECGGASCCVDSVNAFIEEAYGKDNFKLIAFQMMYFLSDNNNFCIQYLCGLHISATDNVTLEKVTNLLNFDFEYKSEYKLMNSSVKNGSNQISKPPVQTIINNTTVINGNGNHVAANDGTISHIENNGNKNNVSITEIDKSTTINKERKNFFEKHHVITGIIVTVVGGVILAVVLYLAEQFFVK